MATEKCNKCRKPVPRISLDVAGVCRSCRRADEDPSPVKFGEDSSGFSSMDSTFSPSSMFDSDSSSSSSNDSSSSDSSSSDFSGGGGDFGGGGSSGEW